MSAIDPSLLFYAGQQQQEVVNSTSNANHHGGGDGDAVMKQEEGGADWQQQRQGDANGADASNAFAAQGASSSAAGPSAAGEAHADSKDDATLAAFLAKMDEYEPILPDNVTRYYLERAGFQSNDDRVTRLLGLAAQKFVSDIAGDALAYARTRAMAGPGRTSHAVNGTSASAAQAASGKQKDRKTTLTLDDLAAAMREYGIEAGRAPYYR